MNNLKNSTVKNSIINLQTAKQYLSYLSGYPLSLDIALPIYSWALLFEKNKTTPWGKLDFKGILRHIDLQDLTNENLFKHQRQNRYLVKNDTFYENYLLEKGELIRLEQADYKTIHQVANYLSSQLKQDSLRVILYQSDSINFKNYTTH